MACVRTFSAVTQDEVATWDNIFDPSGDRSEVVVSHSSFQIRRNKMLCMKTRTWLNDEAINLCMLLLQVIGAGKGASRR
jgi:hypothetical protein